jgi:hypothetical protein
VQACDIGGTLSTKVEVAHKVKTYEVRDPERAFGRESRSLKAAYELQQVRPSQAMPGCGLYHSCSGADRCHDYSSADIRADVSASNDSVRSFRRSSSSFVGLEHVQYVIPSQTLSAETLSL